MEFFEILKRKLSNFNSLSNEQRINAMSLLVTNQLKELLQLNGVVLVPEDDATKIRAVLNPSGHPALSAYIPTVPKISSIWDIPYPNLDSFGYKCDAKLLERLSIVLVRASILKVLGDKLATLCSAGFVPYEVNTSYLLSNSDNPVNYIISFTDLHIVPRDDKYFVNEDTFEDFMNEVATRLTTAKITKMIPVWERHGMKIRFNQSQCGVLKVIVNDDEELMINKDTIDVINHRCPDLTAEERMATTNKDYGQPPSFERIIQQIRRTDVGSGIAIALPIPFDENN